MRPIVGRKLRFCTVAVLATGTVLLLAAVAPAADWPNYRGPNHNGISSETNWSSNWGTDGPKKLWAKSIGIGFSSIVVSNGRAYMMGNTGKGSEKDVVYCLDAVTGKEIWRHTYPCPLHPKYYEGGTLSTPTVDGNVVYTLSKVGDLYCLDAATGKVLWYKNVNKDYGFNLPTWRFSGSPLVMGEVLFFNLGTAGAALDKKTGKLIWDNGKGVCGYATPVPYRLDGQDCLAIAASETVAAVRASDGKVLWTYPFVNRYKVNAADPIVSGNVVFASTGYNRGCIKLDISGGKPTALWDSRVMRNHMNCSVLWKGHIYGFDESTLKCIDLEDGSEKWKEDSLGKGALMMSADGRMIITSDKGELVIANATPSGFKALARAQILPRSKCWTVPVLANGKIYARNAKGDVVCVDVSGR